MTYIIHTHTHAHIHTYIFFSVSQENSYILPSLFLHSIQSTLSIWLLCLSGKQNSYIAPIIITILITNNNYNTNIKHINIEPKKQKHTKNLSRNEDHSWNGIMFSSYILLLSRTLQLSSPQRQHTSWWPPFAHNFSYTWKRQGETNTY